jgi:hypothetical protein
VDGIAQHATTAKQLVFASLTSAVGGREVAMECVTGVVVLVAIGVGQAIGAAIVDLVAKAESVAGRGYTQRTPIRAETTFSPVAEQSVIADHGWVTANNAP